MPAPCCCLLCSLAFVWRPDARNGPLGPRVESGSAPRPLQTLHFGRRQSARSLLLPDAMASPASSGATWRPPPPLEQQTARPVTSATMAPSSSTLTLSCRHHDALIELPVRRPPAKQASKRPAGRAEGPAQGRRRRTQVSTGGAYRSGPHWVSERRAARDGCAPAPGLFTLDHVRPLWGPRSLAREVGGGDLSLRARVRN